MVELERGSCDKPLLDIDTIEDDDRVDTEPLLDATAAAPIEDDDNWLLPILLLDTIWLGAFELDTILLLLPLLDMDTIDEDDRIEAGEPLLDPCTWLGDDDDITGTGEFIPLLDIPELDKVFRIELLDSIEEDDRIEEDDITAPATAVLDAPGPVQTNEGDIDSDEPVEGQTAKPEPETRVKPVAHWMIQLVLAFTYPL
jgi:hypothetical protein